MTLRRGLGNQISFQIPIKADEEGFIGRECPNKKCLGYFKLQSGTGLPGTNLPCHCPYCGHKGPQDHFWTRQQIAYARSIAMRQIQDHLADEFKRMEFDVKPRGAFGIGISMKFKRGTLEPIRHYREKKLETIVICSQCTLRYAVYGVFAFCPDCGTHNSQQILAKNCELARKQIELAANVEDADLKRHLLEDALENAVSAFDGFGREACRVNSAKATNPAKGEAVSFQNLTFATANGEKYVFFGFNGPQPRGLIKRYYTPGAVEIQFSYSGGTLTTASRTWINASSQTVVQKFSYAYLSLPDPNAGRLLTVTLTQKVGAAAEVPVLRAEYTYHTGSTTFGNLGDLKSVITRQFDGADWIEDGGFYYRYYKDSAGGIGFQHGLKYVLGADAAQRMSPLNPRTVTDAVLAGYADLYFEYDGSRRVTKEVVNAASRTYTFSYTASGTGGSDYNVWQTKTVETRPTGGGTITVYTNFVGQVLLRKISDAANNFINYYKYDSDGHMILHAEPSAVVSYNDAQSNLGVTLQSSSGLLHIYQYYASDTSTAAKGYLQFEAVREGYQSGSSTNDSRIREFQYTTRTAGGVTVRPVSKLIEYPYANNTSYAVNTLYSYTWISGTVQMLKRVTALPAVPTTQNGTNTTAERWDQFDEYGNLIWIKDARGYITRHVYDPTTQALTQSIEDTNQSLPSGWTALSGSHLNLTTDYTNDSRGRVTEVLGPAHDIGGTTVRTATWTVYIDGLHPEVWTTQGYLSSGTRYVASPVAPVSVTLMDPDGRVTRTVVSKRDPTRTTAQLTDAESYDDQSRWVRWTENWFDDESRLTETDVYFNIPVPTGFGNSTVNYSATLYDYDTMQRQDGVTSPGGTITRTVFDVRSLPTAVWVGTDDTGFTPSNPTGSSPNNLKTVRSMVYDANGNVTQDRRPVDGTSGNDRVATNSYDFRNRLVATTGLTSNYYMGKGYDNLNRQTVDLQNDISISPYTYVAVQLTDYDDRGHVFQKRRWVTPGSFPSGNVLVDSFWYDDAGNQIQSKPSGSSGWTKQVYDQVGRITRQYTGYGTGGPTSVSSDLIFEQNESTYDDASNLIWMVSRRRFDNAPTSGTGSAGELQTPTAQPNARVTFMGLYYDQIGRQTDVVNWGNNGDNTTLTRPSPVPSRSDTVLVTTTGYNDRGEAYQTYDPSGSTGKLTELTFDHAGRLTQQVEDKVGSPTTYDQNRTTNFEYTADGLLKKLTAVNSVTGDQPTEYCYGTTLSDSQLASSQFLRGVIYPDSTNTWNPSTHTFSGTYNRVEYQRNRQGEVTQFKDQNQTVHDYEYDGLGRLTKDTASSLGTNIDGAVRRIERSYTLLGLPEKVTSYTSTGGTTVASQVQLDYNTLGQLIKEYQEHGAAVNTGSSLNVEYGYENGSANTVRRNSIIYPGPATRRQLTYLYNSGPDTNLSRISKISTGGTDQADYAYLGLGMVAILNLLPPQLRWTLARTSRYDVLDNFDRLTAFTWFDYGSSTFPERLDYTYDRLGNRLTKQRLLPVAAGNDEKYAYDDLYRLVDLTRGTLSGGSITSAKFRQNWQIPGTSPAQTGLDPTGNWRKFRQDNTNGGSSWTFAQTRDHDKANTLTGITTDSGSPAFNTPPGHDQAGNMTTVPQPASLANAFTCTYDAWNRLVKVVDNVTTNTVEEYAYDGLHRRTVKKKYTSGSISETRHYYYSDAWQVLEERVDNSGTLDIDRQFIWGLRYIDDLIRRDRYSSGSINETRFAMQDANFNVTAVTDSNGDVQERFRYDAYGTITALNSSFTPTGNPPANDWETLYAGYHWDATTGLYLTRIRSYHSALGRWLQRDPHQYAEGLSLYEYCSGSPLSHLDPLGLRRWRSCCGTEIGPHLLRLEATLKQKLSTYGEDRLLRLCYDMVSISGWEINELYNAGKGGNYNVFKLPYPTTCGMHKCEGTVTVFGNCYWAADVNYFLWGYIRSRCAQVHWKRGHYLKWARFTSFTFNVIRAYRVFIGWWAVGGGLLGHRTEWARAGWTFAESGGSASSFNSMKNVNSECPPCGYKYEGYLVVSAGTEHTIASVMEPGKTETIPNLNFYVN